MQAIRWAPSVAVLLGALFCAVDALHAPRFLHQRDPEWPALSLTQVGNVYHSLHGNMSMPAAENSQQPIARTLPASETSQEDRRLCVPAAVGGCQLLKDESSFTHQVQDGKKAVSKKGVILAGLLRDDGDSTRKLLDSLHSVGSAFARHHMIIIENDSKDSTRHNMVRECQGPHAWCFELKLPALGPKQDVSIPHRVKHLTWLRQQLLDKVHKFVSTSRESWEFLLMFDGDLFSEGNGGFNPMATLAMLGFREKGGPTLAESPPDVVCSNGIMNWWRGAGRFRDTFALRVRSFDENHPAGQEDFYYKGNKLVSLKSCFSGLALYSLPGLLQSQCKYTYKSEDVCEHVGFHRCLAEHGHGRVALYPPWTIRFDNSGLDPQACRAPREGSPTAAESDSECS